MKFNTKTVVYVGLLAAVSSVLMYFPQFPILPLFPWLKIDFSDAPAILAAITVSPLTGLLIVLIKNLIHLLATDTAALGELSNFLIGGTFVASAGVLFKYLFNNTSSYKRMLYILPIASVIQIVAGVLVNIYIMIPLYSAFVNFNELGGAKYYVLAGVIPFNAIKDAVACVSFYLIYRAINPYIEKMKVK